MPTSAARILANQQNALRSTGPKTPEGKAISRANALIHGLTGEGIAVSDAEAAEVSRRFRGLEVEMAPTTEAGRALLQRFAVLSVRLDRSVRQESAAIRERVRQARADFVPPAGLDEARAEKLRDEAGDLALFDPGKEATLARKYEAAAERGMFRALKEFRQVEAKAHIAPETLAEPIRLEPPLGSSLPPILQPEPEPEPVPEPESKAKLGSSLLPEIKQAYLEAKLFDVMGHSSPSVPKSGRSGFSTPTTRVDIPITIGRSA